MAKAIARIGDITTGHEDFPPVKIITGDDFLTINGIPVAIRGSICEDHERTKDTKHPDRHTPIVSGGSDFITCNGISIAQKGDEVLDNCRAYTSAHYIATGDDFVMCG